MVGKYYSETLIADTEHEIWIRRTIYIDRYSDDVTAPEVGHYSYDEPWKLSNNESTSCVQ